MTPPLLIALPRGLCVSGVTTWGVRLANALVRDGTPAGLILHAEDSCHARLDLDIDPRVRLFDLTDLPPLDQANGHLSPFIPPYREAIESLGAHGPVVLSPNLLGDCYAIAAALTQAMPDRLRIVAWQHSDIAYDSRVLEHYEPIISRFVGVSGHITSSLRHRMPDRGPDIGQISYGVEVGERPPAREPLAGRPLELLYTGRIEHPQKRIGAIVKLAHELSNRGVDHRLTLLGDGPASDEIDVLCREHPSIQRIAPQSRRVVGQMLAQSDIFVLASRYEGLSVSMLEALAVGCVPIVTDVRSGASEAVIDGESGILVDNEPDDDDAIARNLAGGVERALAIGLDRLSTSAHRCARERFGIERHAGLVRGLLGEIVLSKPRCWPASRACAFTGNVSGCSPTMPAHGRDRMREVLASLRGRRVAIHGAGHHTIELAPILASPPCEIVAICDDDPARWGETLLGWSIIAPQDVVEHTVTDVVISSHMHECEIWSRRASIYPPGIAVHRVYAPLQDSGSTEAPAHAA